MLTFGSFFFSPLSFEQTGAGRGYRTQNMAIEGADSSDGQQENGLWRFQLGCLKFYLRTLMIGMRFTMLLNEIALVGQFTLFVQAETTEIEA